MSRFILSKEKNIVRIYDLKESICDDICMDIKARIFFICDEISMSMAEYLCDEMNLRCKSRIQQ